MADSALQLLPNALVTLTGPSCVPCALATRSGSDSPQNAAFNTLIRTNGIALLVAVTAGWN